ncbi:MAG: multidrug ABC transporter ATP-binding protein, partial [Xanthobacteraceae bacterium]
MLQWFESLLEPTAGTPLEPPVGSLARFYWHFVHQALGPIIALFATGLVVALFDLTIPLFIGRVVKLVASVKPAELFAVAGPEL